MYTWCNTQHIFIFFFSKARSVRAHALFFVTFCVVRIEIVASRTYHSGAAGGLRQRSFLPQWRALVDFVVQHLRPPDLTVVACCLFNR